MHLYDLGNIYEEIDLCHLPSLYIGRKRNKKPQKHAVQVPGTPTSDMWQDVEVTH